MAESHTTVSPDLVSKIFKGLEQGDGSLFFEHVADVNLRTHHSCGTLVRLPCAT
jgi:hypothetical protein